MKLGHAHSNGYSAGSYFVQQVVAGQECSEYTAELHGSKMSGRKPILQAFLIADRVYRDQQTGKAIIVGVFDNINAPTVPVVHHECWAYARIVGAPESFMVRLRLIDLTDNEEVGASEAFTARNENGALAACELTIQIPQVPFKRFGPYEFELLINEEPLKGMRLTVKQHLRAA